MPTRFTAYGFTALNAPTPRTYPTRLSEVVNVKDWGAKGNGRDGDSDAINAAMVYALSHQAGGVVFFPAGIYIIDKPPLIPDQMTDISNRPNYGTVQMAWMGCGPYASVLRGTLDNGNPINSRLPGSQATATTPIGWPSFLVIANVYGGLYGLYDLGFENLATGPESGAFLSAGSPLRVVGCRFKGVKGFYNNRMCMTHTVRDCIAECSKPVTTANAASLSPSWQNAVYGSNPSIGFSLSQGVTFGCFAKGFDIGFCHAGTGGGGGIYGNKALQCGVGFAGWDGGNPLGGGNWGGNDPRSEPVGPSPATFRENGWAGNWADRCSYLAAPTGVSNAVVSANTHGRLDAVSGGPYDPVAIQSVAWSSANGGTVTVTCAAATNLPSGATPLLIRMTPAQWTPDGSGNQLITCTKGASNTFTYTGVSSDPTGSHPFASGTWEYPMQGGLLGGQSSGAVWMSNVLAGPYPGYGYDTAYDGASGGGNNLVIAMTVPGGWRVTQPGGGTFGPNARPGGFEFIQCGNTWVITFDQLPPKRIIELGGAGLLPDPIEGDEFNVGDCAQTVGFRGVVTSGGGSNHYKLRRNESGQWIRVG